MLERSRISALIQTWMDYIRLSDLTNAEVDPGDSQQPGIWEKDISLVGNQLLVSRALFQELKQQFLDLEQRGKASDFQIAVAFPQIYVIKDGRRKFLPLFTIDISGIFQGSYLKNGWDLTKFDFHPVLPNLMKFYQIEEEKAQFLVIREGLKVFLEHTFSHPSSTLQNFVELIELPPQTLAKLKLSPYLLRFSYVPYSYNLKKDLQKIIEQRVWDWAVPRHPAWEYLFGQPAPPNHKQLFLGAFPTDAPNEFQASALKHATTDTNSIIAVIGPPGSGKTTLLLHMLAQQVVKRAVHLAQMGKDISNLTVITSTNNRAVSNVEERLERGLPKSSRFYLSGGAKELITQYVLPKLQAAIDWLRSETFNEIEWSQAKSQLLAGVNELQMQLEQDKIHSLQRLEEEQRLHNIVGDINVFSNEIETNQEFLLNLQQQLNDSLDYSQFPFDDYEQIRLQLESAWLRLTKQDSEKAEQPRSWKQRIWGWLKACGRILTGKADNFVIFRLNQKIKKAVLATKDTPFPVELPLSRKRLAVVRENVSAQLQAAQKCKALQQQLAETQSQLTQMQQRRDSLEIEKQQVQNRLASLPSSDFYNRFYAESHQLQQDLFKSSWSFLQQEALRRKQELIGSLSTYSDVLSGERNAFSRLARDWQNIYRDVSLLFPVVITTLHSLRNLLPFPDSGSIDRLIVDEAGVTPLHQLFPALVRSKQAVVVGDPWQLEPVIALSDDTVESYRLEAFVNRGLTNEDYDLFSPTSNSSAYHRAAGASGQLGDLGKGIILREHHRSVEPIASFSDLLCNYGLIIKTPPRNSALGPNLIAYHVTGNYQNHTNLEEIEATEAIINQLLKAGYKVDSLENRNAIGVISPYRSQADALQSRLLSRWKNFANDSIGTVHTFQGGEKSVIILSMRQCRESDSLWFINRKPNLLNVAVSRARELFILVGNLERLQAGGYTQMLVEYIKQRGEVRSLPRVLPKDLGKEKFA